MKIEVVAAWPDRVESVMVELGEGATAREAADRSGLLPGFPLAGMAVFGRRVADGEILGEGDRVELLRALAIDPMEARRRRAEAAKALKAKARGEARA